MTSLVADYDSDLESDSDQSPSQHDTQHGQKDGGAQKLPKPSFEKDPERCAETSVFANRYRLAESARVKALEKHVKMTSGPEGPPGKKVCWNHRKGRCRFGHNCRFAHDADLAPKAPVPQQGEGERAERTKRKPGLARTLVPPKAVLKAFGKQQKRERPWMSAE